MGGESEPEEKIPMMAPKVSDTPECLDLPEKPRLLELPLDLPLLLLELREAFWLVGALVVPAGWTSATGLAARGLAGRLGEAAWEWDRMVLAAMRRVRWWTCFMLFPGPCDDRGEQGGCR